MLNPLRREIPDIWFSSCGCCLFSIFIGRKVNIQMNRISCWVARIPLICLSIPAVTFTEVSFFKQCCADFDCRLTAEDQHHDSSLFLLPLPVNDSRLSGKLDSSSKGIKCCSTLPTVLWKSCNSNHVCLTRWWRWACRKFLSKMLWAFKRDTV